MPRPQLSVDEAFIALIIAAMEADRHAAAEEAARAHQLVRTLPRFRKHSSAAVGRMIEDMKRFVHDHDDDTVIAAAAGAIPSRSRASALATVAEMLLGDGRLRPAEVPFLSQMASTLGVGRDEALRLIAAARTARRPPRDRPTA
jgi:uncharacterized tellurite resistance protein B-like protein